MARFVTLFLATFTLLFSFESNPIIAIDSASGNIRGCVHALTGQFFLQELDAIAPGFEPIPIQRSYVSDNELNWEGGWAIFPHSEFTLYITNEGMDAIIQEPHGQIIRYRAQSDGVTMLPDLKDSVPLPFNHEISARTNPKNNSIALERGKIKQGLHFRKATLYLSNGGTRVYRFEKMDQINEYLFLLEEEIKPNGNRLLYSHDSEDRLQTVVSCNPSKTKEYARLTFNYSGKRDKDRDCTITYSGQTLKYRFWRPEKKRLHKYFYFEEVSGSDAVPKRFLYDEGYKKQENDKTYNQERGPLINQVLTAGESHLKLSYYKPGQNHPSGWSPIFLKNARDHQCGKVKELLEPVGEKGEYEPTYSFLYEHPNEKGPGITKVKDLYGNETHYHFGASFKLSQIDFYSPKELIRTEKFIWDGADLALHALIDPKEVGSIAKKYEYDLAGNVLKQTLYGNLSGVCKVPLDLYHLDNGIETHTIQYTYSNDRFHLPLTIQEEGGPLIRYGYKPGTDLLESKEILDGNQLLIRHLYRYNDDHVLLEETVLAYQNGALSEKKITRYTPNLYNFPETITEYAIDLASGEEIFIAKRTLEYNALHLVEKETLLDAEGNAYISKTGYQGSLAISETNPLEMTNVYDYTTRRQIKSRERPDGPKETFRYDPMGRLKQKEEDTHITLFSYNKLHQKTSETDPYGARAQFDPDRFGNILKEELPLAPDQNGNPEIRRTLRTYDFMGREIFRKDPNGDETITSYNAYSKPARIARPDGHEETFSYYKNSSLKEHIDVEGTSTHFIYDLFGRVLTKEISHQETLLSSETKTYDSLHLLTETDPLGITSTYTYNPLGQKILYERGQERIQYQYDPLGRIEKTIQEGIVSIEEKDYLGRTTEERKENLQGKVLFKKRIAYKEMGRRIEETTFPGDKEATLSRLYDSFGRLKEIQDPYGYKTTFEYTLQPHSKTTLDAKGGRKIETFNALGKIERMEIQNPTGQTLSIEEYLYDLGSQLACQKSTVYLDTSPLKKIETRWVYGPLGRLKSYAQAAHSTKPRTTCYTYTPKGQLFQTIKPSGIIIENTYNRLGQLTELKSSDHSVHYKYGPNELGWVLSATDLNTGLITNRIPDERGHFTQETLSNGWTLDRTYDTIGRCRTVELPGQFFIKKDYDLYLNTVECKDLIHRYTLYDLSGNLIEEELPCQLGKATYAVDLLHRTQGIDTPYYSQRIESFDPLGKVESLLTQKSERRAYSYDGLGQLIRENGDSYTYDSHYNRLSHNGISTSVDDLNQIDDWEYDSDGNVISNGGLQFHYDALDRLTQIELPDGTTAKYTYDPFHRRMTKTVAGNTTRFLYDGLDEIGFEQEGSLTYRILGDAAHAEIGASVAINNNGQTKIPLHDLQGSLACFIDPVTKAVDKENTYTAFGEASDAAQNPWGYLSKHTDAESGLIYFGRRYYDPKVGRWITADPKGYTDSLNLYAFALNDPFLLVDPYGLENLSSNMSPPVVPNRQMFTPIPSGAISNELYKLSKFLLAYTAHSALDIIAPFGAGVDSCWRMLGTGSSPLSPLLGSPGGNWTADRIQQRHQFIDQLFGTLSSNQSSPINWVIGYIPFSPLGTSSASTISKQSIGKISSEFQAKSAWTSTRRETPVENAFRHWKDHGREFPELYNSKQYVEAAKDFVQKPPTGTHIKFRSNGDIVYYNPSSNIFAITNKIGSIRTMFKPSIHKHPYSTNMDYFYAQ